MSNLQHIVFIIDGNRRWAKARGKPSFFGHHAGGKNVEKVTQLCKKQGIKHITFWVLSTENLKERSEAELAFLFKMIGDLPKNISKMDKEGAKIQLIGDISKLPASCQKALQTVAEKTKHNTELVVTLAVNYGGRDEILRAVSKIIQAKLPVPKLSEKTFSSFLDTAGLPDPDLIVRTGGKKRLSGLFPWQGGYSELYFTDIMWPDFDQQELQKALDYFESVQRNFGK